MKVNKMLKQVEKIIDGNINDDDSKEFQKYYNKLKEHIDKIDDKQIADVLDILRFSIVNDSNIYIIGNGGSASTAEHWANDFVKISGLKAFALTNLPTITAYANDKDYDSIFVEQLKVLLRENDIVIGISGSGNSPNIVKALQYTRQSEKAIPIAILGFDGGKAKKVIEGFPCVHIECNNYGFIEDLHLSLCHYLARRLKEEK